jgi:transposase-like protein
VLEGLKGRPIGELCAEHEISQGQYYQWRDQFLANAARAFEPVGAPSRQGRLERENARLKALVGELALELKKCMVRPRPTRMIDASGPKQSAKMYPASSWSLHSGP